MKRVVLFLLTNLAVMLVLGVVVNLLGLNTFISRSGLNLPVLFGFALVFGMGGSFISLWVSKWVAKASTGAEVIKHPRNAAEQWLVETVRRQAEQAGIGMPEVAVYHAPEPNAFATGASRNTLTCSVRPSASRVPRSSSSPRAPPDRGGLSRSRIACDR